jgi:hypothetical protein
MKKLLLAAICLVFFSSCEKEITDLTGTIWGSDRVADNHYVELVFTATHATITESYLESVGTITGTYTFDPPVVLIYSDFYMSDGTLTQIAHKGTIKGRTMEIGIQSGDEVMIITLKKQ